MNPPQTSCCYEFEGFVLDPLQRVVRTLADGQAVRLTARAFDALHLLVAHHGQLVEKETLIKALWPKVVVEENNLTQIIHSLRQTLGEKPGEHRFIATAQGRGYRFVAAVKEVPRVSPTTDVPNSASDREQAPLTNPAGMTSGSVLLDPDARETNQGRLAFGRFILDLNRECVLTNGMEISLRPKTFAVLRHFVKNPGRLVSKEELIRVIWHGGAVTDDTIVQSVSELRRALGDDDARIIKTVPRRGYRFDTEVLPAQAAARAHPSEPALQKNSTRPALLFLGGMITVAIAISVAWLTFSGPRSAMRSPQAAAETRPEAAKTTRPAIAILPFTNPGGEPARQYFADGLTQDVISALGRFSSLTVMSWNAVLPYRNSPTDPKQIARALNVRYQIEGSVQQTGERVRVLAQLVDTEGRVLWSARFDETLNNLFGLQEKLTAQIAGALAARVTQFEQRRVLAKQPGNLEAYDHVLRARPALRTPTRANIAEARAMLKRAIELDPGYAAAYSSLAETYYLDVVSGWAESPAAQLERAEALARQALQLDDADVRAHIDLGRIHLLHARYDEAKAEIERAIAINPNDADGLAGRGHIHMWLGQTDDAINTLEMAQHINPDLMVQDRFALALAYYLKGRYDDAIAQAEMNLRKENDLSASYIVLAVSYAQLGRHREAASIVRDAQRLDPTFDPGTFGNIFLNPADLERLRDGFRKADLHGVPEPGA